VYLAFFAALFAALLFKLAFAGLLRLCIKGKPDRYENTRDKNILSFIFFQPQHGIFYWALQKIWLTIFCAEG